MSSGAEIGIGCGEAREEVIGFEGFDGGLVEEDEGGALGARVFIRKSRAKVVGGAEMIEGVHDRVFHEAADRIGRELVFGIEGIFSESAPEDGNGFAPATNGEGFDAGQSRAGGAVEGAFFQCERGILVAC